MLTSAQRGVLVGPKRLLQAPAATVTALSPSNPVQGDTTTSRASPQRKASAEGQRCKAPRSLARPTQDRPARPPLPARRWRCTATTPRRCSIPLGRLRPRQDRPLLPLIAARREDQAAGDGRHPQQQAWRQQWRCWLLRIRQRWGRARCLRRGCGCRALTLSWKMPPAPKHLDPGQRRGQNPAATASSLQLAGQGGLAQQRQCPVPARRLRRAQHKQQQQRPTMSCSQQRRSSSYPRRHCRRASSSSTTT